MSVEVVVSVGARLHAAQQRVLGAVQEQPDVELVRAVEQEPDVVLALRVGVAVLVAEQVQHAQVSGVELVQRVVVVVWVAEPGWHVAADCCVAAAQCEAPELGWRVAAERCDSQAAVQDGFPVEAYCAAAAHC